VNVAEFVRPAAIAKQATPAVMGPRLPRVASSGVNLSTGRLRCNTTHLGGAASLQLISRRHRTRLTGASGGDLCILRTCRRSSH
jgi:hypothetical protein